MDKRNFMSKETLYQVGYWRKANAIHKWFVDNVANGEDNCKRMYVRYEKIVELKDLVDKVLNDNNLASELLPTTDGFFFGSKEYDEWYFNDLKYTQELLKKVIKMEEKGYECYYEASW